MFMRLFWAYTVWALGTANGGPTSKRWWETSSIYQVYPRSFNDGCSPDCTGNGTIAGLTQRLEYLTQLGIDAIWISPIYATPMLDGGYDIADFTGLWPGFGSMADFDKMLDAAHQLGLKVVLDYVPNHSSDLHPWFLESRSSINNPKRDWYVWHPGQPGTTTGAEGRPEPPNNWRAMFCQSDPNCSAWEWDEGTEQYYYHQFLREQPDLNWRNNEVVEAMSNVLRFWLGKGVDGFRMDAFAFLFEDESLDDQPLNPDYNPEVGDPYSEYIPTLTEGRPELEGTVKKFRAVLSEFGDDRFIVGEIYPDKVVNQERVFGFYGPNFIPFNMELVTFFGGGWDAAPMTCAQVAVPAYRNGTSLRALIERYYTALPEGAQPNFVLGNHDQHRLVSRVGPELARTAAFLLLSLRGTPTIYNGDELGMENVLVADGFRQDPPCKKDYNSVRCRDPERAPIPWTPDSPTAGFSGNATPWLPVWSRYRTENAQSQRLRTSSMLAFYRAMLALRQISPALHKGDFKFLEPELMGPAKNSEHLDSMLTYARLDPETLQQVFIAIINFHCSETLVLSGLGGANIMMDSKLTVVIDSDPEQVVDEERVVRFPLELALKPSQALLIRVDYHHSADSEANAADLGTSTFTTNAVESSVSTVPVGASDSAGSRVTVGVIVLCSILACLGVIAAGIVISDYARHKRVRRRRPKHSRLVVSHELEMDDISVGVNSDDENSDALADASTA